MSERRLSEIAKVLRQPEGIVGSEFTRINKAARKAGIRFDLWQQGFLWLLFAKNAEGKYACGADGAVLSSCRQIGKTFTVGTALFLKAILTPNLKAIWTAHHTRTSDETFTDMCEMEHNPVLGRYVERIRRANGQQEITFTSGSRIMFGARENGFGRGLHSVDVAVFDEAQILTVRAMDNMIPVLNTSPNPLVVYMGNPPKPGDQCDAFTEKRMHALNHDGNLLYVELAADKDADPDDREQWAKANPSYPKRTSEQAIMRMRNNLSDDSFRREALGIWDETATAYAISPDLWQAAAVDDVPEGGTVTVYGLDTKQEENLLAIRQQVGMVFQNPDNQIVATVVEEDVAFALENLGVPPDEMRRRVDESMKMAGIYEYRERAPHNLSGGQKQRVAIAGVVAMRPDCLILDEATAMLDPRGREQVMQTIHHLNKNMGITVVSITHYMEEAAQADRVLVMSKGHVVMEGTPKEVFSQTEKVRSLHLDVPQAAELRDELVKAGIRMPEGIIDTGECAQALYELLQ